MPTDQSTDTGPPGFKPVSQAEWDAVPVPQDTASASNPPGFKPVSQQEWDAVPGPQSTAQSYFDQAADAASFGLGKRAVAAGDALFQHEPGEADSFGDRYSQHLSDENARLAAEKLRHPLASALGSLTGIVASPIGAGVGSLAARAAGEGTGLAAGAALRAFVSASACIS